MGQKKLKQRKVEVSFWDYMSQLVEQEQEFRLGKIATKKSSHLTSYEQEFRLKPTPTAKQLKRYHKDLVIKANKDLRTQGSIGAAISVRKRDLSTCTLVGGIKEGDRPILEPVTLAKKQRELCATYMGLYVMEEQEKLSHLNIGFSHIVHKLLLSHIEVQHELYSSKIEQHAIMPLGAANYIWLHK